MKPANTIMTMPNKTVRQDSTIMEDFLNPRVGMKMKLHIKLAKHWVPKIGELVSMINKLKDSLFSRVMEHLFPIAHHGFPVMGQKAQLITVYFFQKFQLPSGMIISVVIHTAQFASTYIQQQQQQQQQQQVCIVSFILKQSMSNLIVDAFISVLLKHTDYGHPDRAFFQKFETFGLGQTNWAESL
jgi:hypothetical protein